MTKSRFSEELIIGILKGQQAGLPVAEISRRHGISDATFYTWRSRYGGIEVSDAWRLKALDERTVSSRSSWPRRCSTWPRCLRRWEKLLTPGARRIAVSWAIEEKGYS